MLDAFMSLEVSSKFIFVEVRFETKYFLSNLLVLSFESLKFGLPRVEMETPRLELYHLD